VNTRFGFARSFALIALLGLQACAHTPDPMRLALTQIGKGGLAGWTGKEPLIIEFQAGDRLPVHLELGSEDFSLEPNAPALELVAARHCFVRFDEHGVRSSPDGVKFDDPKEPGSFRIGLNATREQPPRLDVILRAPRH
jgi:hypothetical protein